MCLRARPCGAQKYTPHRCHTARGEDIFYRLISVLLWPGTLFYAKVLQQCIEYIFHMAKWTSRDRIWHTALVKTEEIRPEAFATALEISERTARDCLETMHESGVLRKEGGEGRTPASYYSVVEHPEE